MSALELTRSDLEAHEPPEERGRGRDDVALLVADAPRRRARARALRAICRSSSRPGDLLVVNTSATLPAALDGAARRAEPSSSASRRRVGRATPGSSSCAPRRARRCAGRRSARASSSRAARRGAARAVRRQRPARRRPARARRSRSSDYLAATAGRSATATCPQPWPIEAYQTVFARRARQRRDAERRPAVHAPSSSPSSSRAASSSRR